MKIKQYFEYLLYIGVILPENKEQMKMENTIQNLQMVEVHMGKKLYLIGILLRRKIHG